MRSSVSRLFAIALIAGAALPASAAGVRAISKSGQVTTIELPDTGPQARVIVELTERPLLGRKDGRIQSERAKVDRLHERLATDLARSGARIGHQYKLAFSGASVTVDRAALPAIAALPYVKAVHPDRRVKAMLETSVPHIGAPQVWEQLGARGKGVTVAIVDTGIDATHPAFGQRVIGGYDFANGDDDATDDHGHGTHVAGIVAGNAAPVIGVAPEASLLAYKVLDDGGYGEDSGILAAIERLLDPNGDGDFSDRADVVNMSLGKVAVYSQDPIVDAVEQAVASGVVFAIAAGNEQNYFTIGSPGIAPSAITVGATDRDDIQAPFTSQGPIVNSWAIKPEVSAPGVDIVSAAIGGQTLTASGTSMATPHIAGVAALLRELHPEWTPAEVKAAIVSTARPLDSVLATGAGRVDALAASLATILPSPSTIAFGAAGTSAPSSRTLRLTNRGAVRRSVSLAAPELIIEPSTVILDSGETVEVTIALKTAVLPRNDGIACSGRITITGSFGVSYVPWLFVTGDLVAARYAGNDPAIVLMARDGFILDDGINTAVATTSPGTIDILVITMPENGAQPRIIVRENMAVPSGVTVASIMPDEATLNLKLDGRDEQGVPLRSLGSMSRGGIWLHGFDMVLPTGADLHYSGPLSPQWDRDQPLLVSPMTATRLQAYEGEIRSEFIRGPGYVHTAHVGLHRELVGIAQNETLTFTPDQWVTQKFDTPCATECVHYVYVGAGTEPLLSTEFGWTHTSGTVSLTKGGGERRPWFILSIKENERPQVPYTKGVSVISPLFSVGDDGRMRLRTFATPSLVDYLVPDGEPLAYGYGPAVLRATMGMRPWGDHEEWSVVATPAGPLGEEYADDGLRLQVTMYDANGVANPGQRFVTDNYLLKDPLQPGKHRLEIIENFRLGDRMARGTMTSELDTLTGATAPTMTSLRIVDVYGRSITDVGANTDATLQFSARQSTFSTFSIEHAEIDAAATRVWWRSHGGSAWHPLEIHLTATDYDAQDRSGSAGTIYRASLRHIATTQRGAIDLKFALRHPSGATTEWVMEPAFFVTPGRRRAVR